MRLSSVVERILDAIEDKVGPEHQWLGLSKGMFSQLIKQWGDLELNIEVRRVPAPEVIDVEEEEG